MDIDWQFGGANHTSAGMSLVSTTNPLAIGSSCASASLVDSFGSSLWEHPSNSQNMGFCDISVQNGASSSNAMEIGKGLPNSLRSSIDRPFDMGWNAASAMLKGGIFLPNTTGILAQSLSQLPADSAFIERAASQWMKSVSVMESQKSKLDATEATRDAGLRAENRAKASPLENGRKSESLMQPNEEAKQGTGGSGNESDEAEISSRDGGQDEPSTLDGTGGEPSAKDAEIDRAKGGQTSTKTAKDSPENQQKQSMMINKTRGKQGCPASHPPKKNTSIVHWLIPQVRREKISERMEVLQDLVPGCSKVTGKAVMLDEIINYVQSLQRQVEVLEQNLRLPFSSPNYSIASWPFFDSGIFSGFIYGLSSIASSSQPGLVQAPLPVIGNSSDVIHRALSSQLTSMTRGLKEPNQHSNAWEDELHNVVQMNYGTSAPSDSLDVNGITPLLLMSYLVGQMSSDLIEIDLMLLQQATTIR
ncbi:hypothetical protein CXB51_005696 [Gossypium anomalum]|uniref:BHLH domain-containing protein n=1 Tax=Gossypium anomalum TaxID=47600 RepID=A0A8J5ZHI1_9ROSI|nr:hypothetical protein CXB51_005696 [Gossypium anomalum]